MATRYMPFTWDVSTMNLTPFFRTDPHLYHKFENMVFFGQEMYIHFVAQETRIIKKMLFFFNFSSKKVNAKIFNAKIVFLLELVVIINESCYNQANIFLIIKF